MCLVQAVTKRLAIKRRKAFVEALHLYDPFALGNQRLGANDQHRGKVDACPQLFNDETCFNSLAHTNFVGDEQAGAIGTDELQHWSILVWHELNPSRAQRK